MAGLESLESAQAELDLAVDKLNEEITASSTKKSSASSRLDHRHLSSLSDSDSTSSLVERIIQLDLSDTTANDAKAKPLMRKASTFMSSLVPLASVALGVIGNVAEGSAMGAPVAVITHGTCFLLDLAAKEKERKQQFIAELDRITYQARRVHEIQRHPDDAIIPLMREKCLNLLTAIVNFLRGALKYLGQNILKQIGKSLFHGTEVWQKCIAKLHEAYAEYDQALLLQIASTVITHSQRTAIQSADDAEFRTWLSPSSAETEAKLTANLAQRADGTLQWVLDLQEFKQWRLDDASTGATTLWLPALPGVGKSTISAYLVEILTPQYPDDVVLSFSAKRGTPGLTTCFQLIRTLCYQLSMRDDFCRKFLHERPNLPQSTGKDDLIFFFDTLIKKPLGAGPGDKTIFIVLDGLDELEDAGQHASYNSKSEIEILLENLVTLPRVKLLVTSRRLPGLHSVLSKSGVVRPITGTDNAADIEKYVIHRVDKSPKLKNGFAELELDPVKTFLPKANGVFLWVSVVLDVLERAHSSKNFKQALDEVHPTMNSIYDDIFTRAEQRGSLNLMMEVLHWIVILPAPFTVRQMAIATEISLGDKVLDMEEFLRTECGALVDLVPILGSGPTTDSTLEIHIGHETFQAWLSEKFGTESNLETHARAARTCLVYLLTKQVDKSLYQYAATRWRWHLRHSMGVGERQFAETVEVLDGGHAVSPDETIKIFELLYDFLSGPEAEKWLDLKLRKEHYDGKTFWEVHNTYLEVAAWCRTNKGAITDEAIDGLGRDVTKSSDLKSWRDTMDNPQTIARMLWPRICHAWLWNTSYGWENLRWGVTTIHRLYIYSFGGGVFEETEETKKLLEDEAAVVAKNAASPNWKSSGKLYGNLTTHFANTMIASDGNNLDRELLKAVKSAGSFDDMSGVCQANVSLFLYRIYLSSREDSAALDESLDVIQEAIDEDPDGSPRNYYHLAKVYESLKYREKRRDNIDTEKYANLMLQALRDAMDRDADHVTEARCQVYQTQANELLDKEPPALDAAAELLRRALVDDPENAETRWYNQLFDVYKKLGDMAAARALYRKMIKEYPTWHTRWEEIADTWIDEKEYNEKRTFDWRNWCDTLAEAASEDPSYAYNYWSRWASKAESLADMYAFEIAKEIFEYGVETTAGRTDKYGREACAMFYARLADVLVKKGDWEEAVAPLLEALTRSDELDIWRHRDSLKYLIWSYMALERWDDAQLVADKRLELRPDPNWGDSVKYIAHGLKGEIALLEGKPANAVREYKAAVRMMEKGLEEDADGDPEKLLSDEVGMYLIDLGVVYDRMGKPDQAVAMYRKALPHIQHEIENRVNMRNSNESMWRKEGKWYMILGQLLERLDKNDAKVLENYELATWVFSKTLCIEHDFVERTDEKEAHEAVARVKAGQAWIPPDLKALKEQRLRWHISSLRSDWGNGSYQDEVQKPRRCGDP
jgi:tetratricopeptide (TPR) repeat protein